MLCILYVNAVGFLLTVVGLLVERLLPTTAPRRWIWCIAVPLSMFLPGYNRNHHNWVVNVAPIQTVSGANQASVATLTPLDRDWWSRTRAYDGSINWMWKKLSLFLLVWGAANALRVAVLVASSRRRVGKGTPVVDGVPIVVTDQLGPATVGLVRSRVIVPRWVLTLPGMQRRYVLRHEEEHRRAHDAHVLLFYSLPLLLMPWSLALWWQLKRLALAVELDCDNRVVAALGDATAYGELLLTVAQASNGAPRLQPAFLGGMGSLERRLRALVSPNSPGRNQKFVLPVLAAALLFIVVWMPHPILSQDCSSVHTATTTQK